MNIMASNSKIHRCTGNRTACKVRIRDFWQPTDEPLTCVRCGAEPPQPAPSAPEPVDVTSQPMTIAEMLSALHAHIVSYGDVLTISIIPDMPHVTVELPRSDLRDWCERRITSRRSHKNRALRGGSGSPSLGVIRTT